MNKTVNISLAGQIFKIDEKAYMILRNYLDHVVDGVSNDPDAGETIFDVESRIAEIFGGGQEPPILVSVTMVGDMIGIMGAPEDYYDEQVPPSESEKRQPQQPRKAMYNPKTKSSSFGYIFSSFFGALGKLFGAIFHVIAVIIGFFFIIFGICIISAIVGGLTFADTGFITPTIINHPLLLSLVLGTTDIQQFYVMGGVVVFVPLLALIYLGITMIVETDVVSKVTGLVVFILWLVAGCSLAITLASHLSVYKYEGKTVDRIEMAASVDTLYVQAMQRISPENFQYTSIDKFKLWKDERNDKLYGRAKINIWKIEEGPEITVNKNAHGPDDTTANVEAKAISYNCYFSGDTLYLDEYFTQQGSDKWKGSNVTVAVRVKQGTIIKPVGGTDFSIIDLNSMSDPFADYYEVGEHGLIRNWYK